jgi:hypothetical protein
MRNKRVAAALAGFAGMVGVYADIVSFVNTGRQLTRSIHKDGPATKLCVVSPASLNLQLNREFET